MSSRFPIRNAFLPLSIVAIVAFMVGGGAVPAAQTNSPKEHFTAFAVDLAGTGRASAGTVEISVDRWSTDAEADRLLKVLADKGPEKLLDTLQSLPRVGSIRTPNSIGYDLHFAHKHPGEDGGEVISLATDRYISFWEAVNRPRTIDYPFTLIEMHIGTDGTGEGKLSLATKIMFDKKNNTIVLENYGTQPVLLTKVRRDAAPR